MKNKVITALKDTSLRGSERFNTLASLYRQTPNHNLGQARYFNTVGFTSATMSSLEYELKKAHRITDVQLRTFGMKVQLSDEEKLAQLDPENVGVDQAKELIAYSKYDELVPAVPQFEKGLPGNAQMKEFLTLHDVKPKSNKKDLLNQIASLVEEGQKQAVQNLITAREEQATKAQEAQVQAQGDRREVQTEKAKESFAKAPTEVKQGLKLRDEFPFLSEEDCPDEFKILVADKFTALQKFIDARAQLKALQEDPEADFYEIAAEAIDNFELNLEIYDELNYYKEHKEILGHHPIFAKMLREQSVTAMDDATAKDRQKNLRTYVSRDSKKLLNMEDGEAKDKFAAKLDGFKEELALIDARFDGK